MRHAVQAKGARQRPDHTTYETVFLGDYWVMQAKRFVTLIATAIVLALIVVALLVSSLILELVWGNYYCPLARLRDEVVIGQPCDDVATRLRTYCQEQGGDVHCRDFRRNFDLMARPAPGSRILGITESVWYAPDRILSICCDENGRVSDISYKAD